MSWSRLASSIIPMAVGYGAQKVTAMLINKFRERKKEKTRKLLECKINEAFQELKGKMKALQEYLQKLQECRQKEHQLLRAYLEENQGKEGNLARVLLSRMENGVQTLSQRIQTLQNDVQEWPETTKYELELLRADLEMNQGKKEEEISRALVSRMTWKFQQLFQRIGSLEKDLQKLLKSSQHEFQLLRAGQK
ncbi:FYVE and coiled-coil domain-containing protein 1-like isoform X1 [Poecile atricapillus]|uniref:FYVE and coiled-coil domain-containing protein 1-like isoform X1 n=2 Tax=Poecile atricapillus TaxID=48891 RepID=UPI0027388BFF|nr:FYVE and coiled-coil domain-containing protein 1-like isoform X1 [Poecile atricapillus]